MSVTINPFGGCPFGGILIVHFFVKYLHISIMIGKFAQLNVKNEHFYENRKRTSL